MYKTLKLCRPCRNFCVLSSVGFIDPKDGAEKFALVSFANFVSGTLYLINPRENTSESYELPLDNGAWALYNYQNEALIIGTCAQQGCVHRFDLKTRTFAEPLYIDGETYIWNFTDGCDGYLYGGTYSGCKLLRYDLAKHKLEDLGRVSSNKENLYARFVAHIDGYIIIDVGQSVSEKYVYRQSDGKFFPSDDVGEFPSANELLKSGDTRAQNGCRLPSGSLVSVVGQEYIFYECISTQGVIRHIPGEPPATGILTLTGDGNGKLWGSTNFGMTIFNYDIKTNAYENTTTITPYGGGEVYGMVFNDDKLYMTSYANGFHVVYDPLKQWDSRNDVNPHIINAVSPEYIRPHAKTVIGPENSIWTGWYARYGEYGGAISKIDTKTGSVSVYPVGNRGVASVAADENYVYYVTHGGANGLCSAKGPFKLCAVDIDGIEQRQITLSEAIYPNILFVNGDDLILSEANTVIIYSKETFNELKSLPISGCNCIIRCFDKILAFGGDKNVYAINSSTYEYEKVAMTIDEVHTAWATDNAVYYGCGTELWKLEQ